MTKAMKTKYDHRVTVPEGEVDGLAIERFTVEAKSLENIRLAFNGGRSCIPGEYTKLIDKARGGLLWMSDTTAEWYDHMDAVWKIREPSTKRVLINGLGIGMVLKAALACEHVEHVDVVELDERCIKLVGPHYTVDPRVTIHQADAYAIKWSAGTRWDVAWHDIWKDICEDNLPLMAKLHRSYGRRVGWQGSWCKEQLVHERRRTADAWWR